MALRASKGGACSSCDKSGPRGAEPLAAYESNIRFDQQGGECVTRRSPGPAELIGLGHHRLVVLGPRMLVPATPSSSHRGTWSCRGSRSTEVCCGAALLSPPGTGHRPGTSGASASSRGVDASGLLVLLLRLPRHASNKDGRKCHCSAECPGEVLDLLLVLFSSGWVMPDLAPRDGGNRPHPRPLRRGSCVSGAGSLNHGTTLRPQPEQRRSVWFRLCPPHARV
jgi:hypothetical protein